MPWKETDVVNERTEFALRAMGGLEPFGELCQEFGISRKTGYKWKKRFLERHRRRRKPPEQDQRVENRVKAERPNQVWTVDFKGWWYTRERQRFEPLTIRDDFSRYILCAQATANARTETVRAQFGRVFGKYGLPEIIRSDNGSPFAAPNSPLGLSRLSAWWLTLGIDLDRIQPGRPDQNGGHERMHRDIALELERFSAVDWATQQASLDTWRRTFNHERPHEAIGMQVPNDLYRPSLRRYESEEVELCYPKSHLIRKVLRYGAIKINNQSIGISSALSGHKMRSSLDQRPAVISAILPFVSGRD